MSSSYTPPQPDSAWETFASREPYFAVLTSPKFLRASLTPAREREFFRTGERLVDWIFRTIDLRLVPEFAPASILEYGCGVGRLALPLSRRGAPVVAVDRSPAMLDVARQHSDQEGDRITFETPRQFFAARRQFDLVSCYLLFQRLPRREGLSLLRQLLACIRPDGIGVFQFPYKQTTGAGIAVARWMRERIPMVNTALNLARGKPAADPFVPSHTYDLDEIFSAFNELAVESCEVAFEHQPGFDSLVVFVRAPSATAEIPAREADPVTDPGIIDVRDVIARTSVEDLNRAAEEYFASLTDWDHHLAKPFSTPEEAPPLLMDVATLLQGMKLLPGMTILDFGAGTGWLSRSITQLGCRVVLLDVSHTALNVAQELYRRLPVIGLRPEPTFLPFDGRRIALDDDSVDRIVSFHAFHHVPNPAEVLAELARILKPGGIAGFVEPGPRHSLTPQSQFEMRTYQVVENDIDIHEIERIGQSCGLETMRVVISHKPPFHVLPAEFDDFLAGGEMTARWVASTREHLRHVRSFFLTKRGTERSDSRASTRLACEIGAPSPVVTAIEGLPIVFTVTVKNCGGAIWLPSTAPLGGVLLGAHLYDADGSRLGFDVARQTLSDSSAEIKPGSTVRVQIQVPPQRAGRFVVELDCVATGVAWFSQCGSASVRVPVEVVSGHKAQADSR
jgi:2-polyprenyl-3-methyl-5-hydroxy-6-metoxy-1,4-benzoquinol methylase